MKRVVVGVLLLALFGAACAGQGNQAYRPVPYEKLTPAERTYGLAPHKNSSITYQSDVVIVGGGASSVVSQSNSGVSVVLKAGAPKLSEVKVGKIVLVTGRIVGRVVGTKETSTGVEVFMTPVQLTDVVRDAKIEIDKAPIDPATSTVVQGQKGFAPERGLTAEELKAIPDGAVTKPATRSSEPATYEPVKLTPAGSTPVAPARFVLPAADSPISVPPIPPVPGGSAAEKAAQEIKDAAKNGSSAIGMGTRLLGEFDVNQGSWGMTPMLNGGVGLALAYDRKGVSIRASLLLKLKAPTVTASILIRKGEVIYAGAHINGAAGLHMAFSGSSGPNFDNTHLPEAVEVPWDFSIPLGGPLPLVLDWRQKFILNTGFSARNTTLALSADYTLSGGIGFAYQKGKGPGVETLSKVTAVTSATDNMSGISVGINSLVLAYQAKLILGIGAFGFATGLKVSLNTSWGISKSTDISVPPLPCKQVTFSMNTAVGIGWAIPKVLAWAVNTFLSLFGIKARIPSSGGWQTDPINIIEPRRDWTPDKAYCRLKPP